MKKMGHKDLMSLHRIYERIKIICKENSLSYNFKVDDGDWETAIEFIGEKSYHPPISVDWSNNPQIFCPDLLDYESKIIIEFEEEIGNPQTGAKLATKGHNREGDFPNKRDTRREEFYNDGHFQCLQIWESDENWEQKLERLLIAHTSIQ